MPLCVFANFDVLEVLAICVVVQLQLPIRNTTDLTSHQCWVTSQTLVFASLGRYTARFGQLYGAQFHAETVASQELLSGDYVSEKLIGLWDTFVRLWSSASENAMARYAPRTSDRTRPCLPR